MVRTGPVSPLPRNAHSVPFFGVATFRASRKKEIALMRRGAIMALVLGVIGACAFAQGARQPTGAVQGLVFITDADSGRSVVPATKITLDGPAHIEAQSDNDGKFAFSTVPAGSYTVTVNAPGMSATQGVVVTAGAVSQVQLEMKLEVVTESTTVPTLRPSRHLQARWKCIDRHFCSVVAIT